MQAIRKAIKNDGTWLIADVHGQPTFEENLKEDPLAPDAETVADDFRC